MKISTLVLRLFARYFSENKLAYSEIKVGAKTCFAIGWLHFCIQTESAKVLLIIGATHKAVFATETLSNNCMDIAIIYHKRISYA